jgi:hypothetical protein
MFGYRFIENVKGVTTTACTCTLYSDRMVFGEGLIKNKVVISNPGYTNAILSYHTTDLSLSEIVAALRPIQVEMAQSLLPVIGK